jgi:hypothetical protein
MFCDSLKCRKVLVEMWMILGRVCLSSTATEDTRSYGIFNSQGSVFTTYIYASDIYGTFDCINPISMYYKGISKSIEQATKIGDVPMRKW